jgi:UDP-N-acetylmuramoyl-tripeptide--D-alanyl-D-alanine ligase
MKDLFKNVVVGILTFEAKILLRRTKPIIIAVTGSVGKTSTKDAIFSVLKNYRKTRKSEKSFNSEIGVPLSVLGLPNAWNNPVLWMWNIIEGFFIACFSRNYPEVLVLEAGVDRQGDMKRLTAWLRPDIAVITRLPDVPVHVEYFTSPEAVAEEKLELVRALKPNGVFIYNHDDAKLLAAVAEVRQPSIGFSRYAPSQFTAAADEIVYHDDIPVGSQFTITHMDETVTVKVNGSIGVHNAYTYSAAAAVAAQFDIPLTAVAEAVRSHQGPAGRMRVIPGIKGVCILDDTYNSSPIAVEGSLQSLRELRGFKRKIAVLGDMLELGQFSTREHERMGAVAAEAVDMLLTVGVRSRKTAEGALEHGLSEKNILQYEDSAAAGKELQQLIRPGDVVLVKGSQGVRAERVVEEIMAEPQRAGELLVRQESSWKVRS